MRNRKYPSAKTDYVGVVIAVNRERVQVIRETLQSPTLPRWMRTTEGHYWVIPVSGGPMRTEFINESELEKARRQPELLS